MKTKLYNLVSDLWDKGLCKEIPWLSVADQLYGSYYTLCELGLGTYKTHDSMYFIYCIAYQRYLMEYELEQEYEEFKQMREFFIN